MSRTARVDLRGAGPQPPRAQRLPAAQRRKQLAEKRTTHTRSRTRVIFRSFIPLSEPLSISQWASSTPRPFRVAARRLHGPSLGCGLAGGCAGLLPTSRPQGTPGSLRSPRRWASPWPTSPSTPCRSIRTRTPPRGRRTVRHTRAAHPCVEACRPRHGPLVRS